MALIYFYDSTDLDKQQLTEYLSNTDHTWHFAYDELSVDNIHPDTEVLSVFVSSNVTSDIIQKLPKLKLIACRSTGFNNVDLNAAQSRGITVVNVPSYGETTVAEYTFTLILALARKLSESLDATMHEMRSELLTGFDLHGKTIGVVGTGRIGLRVIQIAKGFGMNVVAFDPYPNEDARNTLGFSYLDLDNLLRVSDVVSLHAPYTPENYHLIDSDRFKLIKKTAIIINTARGELIDTFALINALETNRIAGAALDVVEGEHLFKLNNEMSLLRDRNTSQKDFAESIYLLAMQKLPNIIMTPHNAFNTIEAISRINTTTAENIIKFWYGDTPNKVETKDIITGRLMVVRHAESLWNASGKWTGRRDVHLSEKGFHESALLGLELKGHDIDIAICSEQIRTFETLQGILNVTNQIDVPITRAAAINERDYGDYTGINKWEMLEKVGIEEFTKIRRGWDYHIPNGETLKDVYNRTVPYYLDSILPLLKEGKNVLLVAHGNSIRALTKYIEQINENLIGELEMTFGTIAIYSLDEEGRSTHKQVLQINSPPPNA